jgi:PAS domain S-box-containing protein
VALFAAYLSVRAEVVPALRTPELCLAAALATVTTVLWIFLKLRRDVSGLTRQVEMLAEQPLVMDQPVPEELQPLTEALTELATRYRQALQDKQHAENSLQSLLGKADDEEGESHSLVPQNPAETGLTRDLICRLSPELVWLAATPALQRFLGYSIVELNTRSFLELVLADDVPALQAQFDRAMQKGESHNVPLRLRLRGGAERHILMEILTRYTPEGKPLSLRCYLIDVTDRIVTDSELRQRTHQLTETNDRLQQINKDLERLKESYRDLYHNAPVMYFSLDDRSRFVACNDTMLRTLGYSRADLHEKPLERILTPTSQEQVRQRANVFHQTAEIEAQWIKKDKSVIDVWIRNVPVNDADGKFMRSRSVAQDVTERNRLANALRSQAEELRRTNDQLRRINRELDDFTYVVSHDLKEPLRTLQAFSNFLIDDFAPKLGPEGKEYIDHLIQASRRLGLLIDDLLNLSRAGRVVNTLQSFDLTRTIQTVKSDLTNLIRRKNAEVVIVGELPAVVGDHQRMAQLLTNLVSNGLKYNENPQPRIEIGIRADRVEKNGADGIDYVTFYVKDNGIGIDSRFHEQIFGMFRRLHLPEEYEGTGAGLAICKKIVEAHGGRIWVESEPGQGSTFFFTLPRPLTRTPRGETALSLAKG